MKKFAAITLFVFSLLFIANGYCNETGKFVESPCPLDVPEGLVESGKFSYGYMKVPEFHDNPDGKYIELAIAVFKCQSDFPTHEPLILITGGPGNSDIQGFLPLLFGNFGKLFLDNRDVVIIELRGLKYSRPNLFCPELDDLQMELLSKNLTAEETVLKYMDTLQSTYDRFNRQGVNLSAFNNYEIANDIVFVMENLNYQKFSVFGASFGTLVVQHLLLNHSEHIESAVMNAVVDVNHCFSNMHTNSIKTLDVIFERCEKDEEIRQAFPELKNRFLALIEKLNESPDTILVRRPGTNKMHNMVLNGNRLSVWIFAQMYWNTQIPLTLSKLFAGDYSEIIQSPHILFPLQNFSNGLSLSIILSEFSNLKNENIPVNNEYANYVKGCGTLIFTPYFLKSAKDVWQVNDLSPIKKSIISDVPTLMLSGEMDHVCPPEDVVRLSKQLKNSHLFIFPGVAHSPVEVGTCGLFMMKEFIDNPTKAPNSDCVKEFHSVVEVPDLADN